MTDNLPAVRETQELATATADTDSWITVVADVARLSEHIASTEFVPKNLRNKAPAVAAAILYGREVGLPPMTALTQTHVIEGRPSMSAEAMRALVVAAGHEFVTSETTGALCTMRARRKNTDTWTEVTWTIDMARAAGLMGKDNWKNYPRQMLQARCTAELVRLVFPDVIHGFKALEEIDETGEADDTAASAFEQPKATVSRAGTRKRTPAKKSTTAALPKAQPAARPVMDGPPLPGEEPATETAGEETPAPDASSSKSEQPESGGEAADVSSPAPDEGPAEDPPADAGPSPDEKPRPGPVSRAQQRMMHARFVELGLDDEEREERLRITRKIVGRDDLSSSNDLTKADAQALLDTLARVNTLGDLLALVDPEES